MLVFDRFLLIRKVKFLIENNFTGSQKVDTRFDEDIYNFGYKSIKDQLQETPIIYKNKEK